MTTRPRSLSALIALILLCLALPKPAHAQRWLERWGRFRVAGPNERNHQTVKTAFREVVAPTADSVVWVLSAGTQVAHGSIVDASGLVLTKASELKGDLTCQLADGKRLHAKQVSRDVLNDLALLQLEDVKQPLTPLRWRQSPIGVGSWVVSVGMGQLPMGTGVVSNTPRRIPRHIPYLGVMMESVDQQVVIMNVLDDSAADSAGLEAGDIVVEVDGRRTPSQRSVQQAIRRHRPGDTIVLKIQRKKDGEESEGGAKDSGDADASTESAVEFESLELKAVLGDREEANGEQAKLGGPLSTRRGGFPLALQHDTILEPKDVGGPLVDLNGETVGINIARAGRVETYALPASEVQALLTQLKAKARIE